MTCVHCGAVLEENSSFCTQCGQAQNLPAEAEVAVETENEGYFAPAFQLPTNRSLVKMIFLSMVTFGIYGIVQYCRIARDINLVATRYDGKVTMPYMAMVMFSVITLGIVPLVWQHRLCGRIGDELARRGYDYSFGAKDFWLWGFLGSAFIAGPFIYCHRLMTAMNLINSSYNYYG